MPTQEPTKLELPAGSTAKVTGPMSADMQPGAKAEAPKPTGYYASFEKYGFAGLVAFFFGILIYNQLSIYDKLSTQREADLQAQRNELREFRESAERRLDKQQEREDKYREKMWMYMARMWDGVKAVMQNLKIGVYEIWPLPNKKP